MEARGGIEPPIKALQALALPLGDRAPVRKTAAKMKNPPTGIPAVGSELPSWTFAYLASHLTPEHTGTGSVQHVQALAVYWV